MKLIATILSILAVACFAHGAMAQAVHYDSVYLGSMYPVVDVADQNFALGKADGSSAHFGGHGECAARFMVGNQVITMQKGQQIHVYWYLPSVAPGDSNLAFFHLQRLSEDFRLTGDTVYTIAQTNSQNTEGMYTIVVPDTGFNAIAVSVATTLNANSFWLDAVHLIQTGEAGVFDPAVSQAIVLQSYPNPFVRSTSPTLHIVSPEGGQGALAIVNALGQEMMQIPLGMIDAGERDVRLSFDRPGVFFARLLVDGNPVGAPLKLTSE